MLIDTLVKSYAPYLCVGCGEEGKTLLCEQCVQNIITVPPRCYRCKGVSRANYTCESCNPKTPLRQVLVLARYDGLIKEVVHSFKYERAQGASRQLAALLQPLLIEMDGDYVLVPVPTATSRVRQRGYDHAELLAKRLSKIAHRPHSTTLARIGQAHQVGSNRQERLEQVKGVFRVKKPAAIKGKQVLLVDDILTTGATLEEAARVLKRAGAKTVSAIVIAQP